MNKTELVVIINSFNRLELLKKSLDSLVKELRPTGIDFAVVIFEAGSTDGSIEWIQQYALVNSVKLKVVTASENEDTSFSYGVNKACQWALEHYTAFNYFFLYETDNYLKSSEPVLQATRLLDQNKELGACGFTVKKHNGSDAGFGCSLPAFTSFVLGQQLSFFLKLDEPVTKWIQLPYCEYSYSEVVYTSPLLIKKEVWEKVKGFDSVNFPFSDCDIDLAKRVCLAGKKMAVIKTSSVIHDNLEMKSSWSATRTIRFYRSRFTYFKKYYGFIAHLLKPFLFITHILEFVLLLSLVILNKREVVSLKARWFLITRVFFNYK